MTTWQPSPTAPHPLTCRASEPACISGSMQRAEWGTAQGALDSFSGTTESQTGVVQAGNEPSAGTNALIDRFAAAESLNPSSSEMLAQRRNILSTGKKQVSSMGETSPKEGFSRAALWIAQLLLGRPTQCSETPSLPWSSGSGIGQMSEFNADACQGRRLDRGGAVRTTLLKR